MIGKQAGRCKNEVLVPVVAGQVRQSDGGWFRRGAQVIETCSTKQAILCAMALTACPARKYELRGK